MRLEIRDKFAELSGYRSHLEDYDRPIDPYRPDDDDYDDQPVDPGDDGDDDDF